MQLRRMSGLAVQQLSAFVRASGRHDGRLHELQRVRELYRSVRCKGERHGIGQRFHGSAGAGKRELGVGCFLPEWTRWWMQETVHLGNINNYEVKRLIGYPVNRSENRLRFLGESSVCPLPGKTLMFASYLTPKAIPTLHSVGDPARDPCCRDRRQLRILARAAFWQNACVYRESELSDCGRIVVSRVLNLAASKVSLPTTCGGAEILSPHRSGAI